MKILELNTTGLLEVLMMGCIRYEGGFVLFIFDGREEGEEDCLLNHDIMEGLCILDFNFMNQLIPPRPCTRIR